MAKQLLQSLLTHQQLDTGTIHWKTGKFVIDEVFDPPIRYATDDNAVLELEPDDEGTVILRVRNATCVIVLDTKNAPTVWLDENFDPLDLQAMVNEFMTSATTPSCASGT